MAGVKRQHDALQSKVTSLQDKCTARYEAGEKSQAYNQFKDQCRQVRLSSTLARTRVLSVQMPHNAITAAYLIVVTSFVVCVLPGKPVARTDR